MKKSPICLPAPWQRCLAMVLLNLLMLVAAAAWLFSGIPLSHAAPYPYVPDAMTDALYLTHLARTVAGIALVCALYGVWGLQLRAAWRGQNRALAVMVSLSVTLTALPFSYGVVRILPSQSLRFPIYSADPAEQFTSYATRVNFPQQRPCCWQRDRCEQVYRAAQEVPPTTPLGQILARNLPPDHETFLASCLAHPELASFVYDLATPKK